MAEDPLAQTGVLFVVFTERSGGAIRIISSEGHLP